MLIIISNWRSLFALMWVGIFITISWVAWKGIIIYTPSNQVLKFWGREREREREIFIKTLIGSTYSLPIKCGYCKYECRQCQHQVSPPVFFSLHTHLLTIQVQYYSTFHYSNTNQSSKQYKQAFKLLLMLCPKHKFPSHTDTNPRNKSTRHQK